MPLNESEALILRTYPLGEADRIVVFFSRAHGKVRGVANGARKLKNRFGASLEPLAHSRIIFAEKENRELVRIQSSDLLDSSLMLFQDYDRAMLAGHLVDLIDRFLPDHDPQDAVFRLTRSTISAIGSGCALEWAEAYFEIWMLRLAGVLPNLFACRECGRPLSADDPRYFETGRMAVCCAGCAPGGLRGSTEPIAAEVLRVVEWVIRNPLRETPEESSGLRSLKPLTEFWIRHYLER